MLRCSMTVMMTVLALSAGVAGADVYMDKDANGRTIYTDKPATLPAERLNVQSRKTDTVEVQARQQAELARMQAANQARTQTAAQQADQKAASELSAKDKAERCTKARERYDNYMNSQQLYKPLPDGGRQYLSDEELTAARNAAKASMDELCK